MKSRQCPYLWGLRRFFLEKENKKSKKVEKSFKKLLTSCSSSDNIYLADARESKQQRPDKRSEKLDN